MSAVSNVSKAYGSSVSVLHDDFLHLASKSEGNGVIQTTASESTFVCPLAACFRVRVRAYALANMPKFIEITDQDVSDIAKEGGNKEETVKRRDRSMSIFREFGASREEPVDVDELIERAKNDDPTPLAAVLEQFFTALRVGPNSELPKKNTADMYR